MITANTPLINPHQKVPLRSQSGISIVNANILMF
jgi:hypothetical protein